MNAEFWNERFSEAEWAYGQEPNDFVRMVFSQPGQGRILCLAEGQGRNAVYLAKLGYEVYALDYSSAGLQRCQELAASQNVHVHTLEADLTHYVFQPNAWDGILSIFGHLPSALRRKVNAQLHGALKPGGVLCMEGYHLDQLNFKTGGPGHPDLLYTEEALKMELGNPWSTAIFQQAHRQIKEGPYHDGPSSTLQIFARV